MDIRTAAPFLFTAEIYEPLMDDALEQIELCKKQENPDKNRLAELYGIYYHLFAGMIRSTSCMYKKDMEEDGYATVVLSIRDKTYTCKDSALRDIFKEEYDFYVKPYEDNSLSWVKPYDVSGVELSLLKKEAEKDAQKKGGLPFGNDGPKKPQGNIQGVDIPVGYGQMLDQNGNPIMVNGPDYSDRLPALFAELESISGSIMARVAGIIVCLGIMAASLAFL